MKDAFDAIERDLRRAVRARRRRRARRALALAGGTLLVVAAAATPQIARSPDVEREAPPPREEIERVAFKVVKATMNRQECRPARQVPPPQTGSAQLSPRITRVLPALATPVPGADPQRAVALLDRSSTTGMIVSESVRTLEFPDGQRLTVFVLDGAHTPEQDPAACAKARRERAAELASGELLVAVEWLLATAGAPPPGQQYLYLAQEGPPGPSMTGSLSSPSCAPGSSSAAASPQIRAATSASSAAPTSRACG
jgi:hypothetical protein